MVKDNLGELGDFVQAGGDCFAFQVSSAAQFTVRADLLRAWPKVDAASRGSRDTARLRWGLGAGPGERAEWDRPG